MFVAEKNRAAKTRTLQSNSSSMSQRTEAFRIDRSRQGRKHWNQCLNNGKSLINICFAKSDDTLAAFTLNLLATLSGLVTVYDRAAKVHKRQGKFKMEGEGSLTTELGLSRPGLNKRLTSLGCPTNIFQYVDRKGSFALDDLVVANRFLPVLIRRICEHLAEHLPNEEKKLKDWPTFKAMKRPASAFTFHKRILK